MTISVTRYHDFSYGHRVVGHESKCRWLHGHNGRVHFTACAGGLDSVGRVIDFGDMKSKLCMWLEENWDHKFLAWEEDRLFRLWPQVLASDESTLALLRHSIVLVPFNPTAENIAEYLLKVIGPKQLEGTGIWLQKVVVEETRKCSAQAELILT